jgi:cytochrome c553
MIRTRFFALTLAGLLSNAMAQAQVTQAGSAAAGETKASMCIGCHGIVGYQASFPEVHKVPMISGQGAKYIVASLNAYKKGERKHPTMRSIAASLSEQDMADFGAFYAQHGAKAGAAPPDGAPAASAEVAALLTKGACASCHGANFNQPIDPSYPKIAGQHADYLYVALRSYKVEGNPSVGRANAIMGGIAKQFTNAELKRIADHLATLPGELRTVKESYFR